MDLNKKQTDSNFIKSLSSQPRKEFEIQKRLDKLRDIKRYNNKNNNSNNSNNRNDGDLFSPQQLAPGNNIGPPPSIPTIQDFIDPYPEEYDLQQRLNQDAVPDSLFQQRLNNLRGISNPSPPPFFANDTPNFHVPAQTSSFNRNFVLDQLIKLQGMIYSVHRLKH